MTDRLTFALIQSKLLWEEKAGNLRAFKEKIDSIEFEHDVVVLPEMFTTGFSMNTFLLAEPMNGDTIEWLKEMSINTGKHITGSFIAEENGKHYNRLIWMCPDGVFFKYDKKHLFRMAGEDNYYTAGNEKIIVDINGWKIRPLICYDLRFPVWSRNRFKIEGNNAIPEYDVLLYVANWPAARSLPWDILLRARAVENQVYCIGLNRVGFDGNKIEYTGHSTAINPRGEYILNPKESAQGIFKVELEREDLGNFRIKFPQGLDSDNFILTD